MKKIEAIIASHKSKYVYVERGLIKKIGLAEAVVLSLLNTDDIYFENKSYGGFRAVKKGALMDAAGLSYYGLRQTLDSLETQRCIIQKYDRHLSCHKLIRVNVAFQEDSDLLDLIADCQDD